jgi:hypothetical protein
MALGSTQPLTEISTRNLPGIKGRPVRKSDNFTAICEPIVQKMWAPRRLAILWASTASYRDSFSFTSEPSGTDDTASYTKGITKDWIILHINTLKPGLYEIGAGVLNVRPLLHSKNIEFPLQKSTV